MFNFFSLPVFVSFYLSITISLENEMYFSSLFGIQLIFPSLIPTFFTNKWASYPDRLWKITGLNLGFLNWRLHCLCAAPRYFPVKWQWSLTLSSLSFSWQIQQTVAFSYSNCSSFVKGIIFLKSWIFYEFS